MAELSRGQEPTRTPVTQIPITKTSADIQASDINPDEGGWEEPQPVVEEQEQPTIQESPPLPEITGNVPTDLKRLKDAGATPVQIAEYMAEYGKSYSVDVDTPNASSAEVEAAKTLKEAGIRPDAPYIELQSPDPKVGTLRIQADLYEKATPQQKFNLLQRVGQIPQDAVFDTATGGYTIPSAPRFAVGDVGLTPTQLAYIRANDPKLYAEIRDRGLGDVYAEKADVIVGLMNTQQQEIVQVAQQSQGKERADWETNVLPTLPNDMQDAYKAGNLEQMRTIGQQYLMEQAEFDRWIESAEAPSNLRDAYRKGGYTGYQAEIARMGAVRDTALQQLKGYETPEGQWRVADFIQDNVYSPFKEKTRTPEGLTWQQNRTVMLQVLTDAGFTPEDIVNAEVAVYRPSEIKAVSTEEFKALRPNFIESGVLDLEKWQTNFFEGLEKEVQRSQTEETTPRRLTTSFMGGVGKTLATVALSPIILTGRIVTNPVGAPKTVYETGKGMVTHVVDTSKNIISGRYVVDIARGDLSSLVYDSAMTYLIVTGTGKAGKAVVSRVTTYVLPRSFNLGSITKESSTGRIPVNLSEMSKEYADAMNKVEVLAMQRGGKFSGNVPIEGTPYQLRYLKTPMQQVVGDTLFHGTKTELSAAGKIAKESLLDIASREGKVTAGESGIYTSPWAAIGYTRGGSNPGLLMVLSDAAKIKSGAKGLSEGVTQADTFIKGSGKGFYGSSKVWRGDLETEIVGAPGTIITVPPANTSLVNRILAGKPADFITYDSGRFVPIKIGLDAKSFKPETLQMLQNPATWYSVKLYSLYGALRDTAEAIKRPDLVLKDVSGITKEMLNLDRILREGTGSKGSGSFPGVRDVYLTQSLGSRLQMIANKLFADAFSKTKKQLGDKVSVDSSVFKRSLEKNLEESYRASADSIINAYTPVAMSYPLSQTTKRKFESAYLGNLSASSSALVKSADAVSVVEDRVQSDISVESIPDNVKSSVKSYAEYVAREQAQRGETIPETQMQTLTPTEEQAVATPSTEPSTVITPVTPRTVSPISRITPTSVVTMRTPVSTVSTKITTPVTTPIVTSATTPTIPTTLKTPVISIVRMTTNSPMSQPVPEGSIAFAMGERRGIRGIQVPQWYYIPPEDFGTASKPRSLEAPPTGAKNTDKRDPYTTIQVIGRSRLTKVPNFISVDMGITDAFITNGNQIEFKGKGSQTNVGTRLDSNTKGMSVENGGDVLDEVETMPITRRGFKRPKMSRKLPPRKGRRTSDDFSSITSLRGLKL